MLVFARVLSVFRGLRVGRQALRFKARAFNPIRESRNTPITTLGPACFGNPVLPCSAQFSKHRKRFVKCAVAVVLLSACVLNVGMTEKLTVDPNTPEGRALVAQKPPVELGDPALGKKLTYESNGQSLSKILPEVSVLSGVKMLASSAKENWQIRQREAIVLVNDRPVLEIKDGIALLFGYRWSRMTLANKEKAYVLRDTLQRQVARQKDIDKQQQETWRRRTEGIDAAIAAAENSGYLSADELKDARENNPYLYYLASDPTGRLWAQVLKQIPENWWQSAAGGARKLYMMNGEVPDSLSSLFGAIAASPTSASSTVNWVAPYEASPGVRALPIVAIEFSPFGDGTQLKDPSARISMLCGDGPVLNAAAMFPIGSPTAADCFVLGKQAIAMEEGKSVGDAFNTAFDALKTGFSKMVEAPQTGEKPDEALLRRIEHKPLSAYGKDGAEIKETGLVRQLRGLAKETGYSILVETFDWLPHESDTYTHGGFPPSEGTVYEVIKGIASTSFDWQKKGNILLLKPKDWQRRRALEVNVAKVKEWEELAGTQGGLLFNDMLDVVSNTTFGQIRETLTANALLCEAGVKDISFSLYGALRLITLMPDGAFRQALLSEGGLPVSVLKQFDLSEEQLKPYRDLVQNDAGNTVVGVTVRNLDKNSKDGRQEVTIFTRSGADVVSTEKHMILPSFQADRVREMLKQRGDSREKDQHR